MSRYISHTCAGALGCLTLIRSCSVPGHLVKHDGVIRLSGSDLLELALLTLSAALVFVVLLFVANLFAAGVSKSYPFRVAMLNSAIGGGIILAGAAVGLAFTAYFGVLVS